MRSDHLVWDLVPVQQPDQVRPGHVERIGGLLCCEHGPVRHDLHALPIGKHAENLRQHDRDGPRDNQSLLITDLHLDRDRLVVSVPCQVVPDPPRSAKRHQRVNLTGSDCAHRIARHSHFSLCLFAVSAIIEVVATLEGKIRWMNARSVGGPRRRRASTVRSFG